MRTSTEEVVVRASRLTGEPENDFWWGLWCLFGTDPRRVFELKVIHHYLADFGSISVPRVIRMGYVEGRPHIVVERMHGHTLRSFSALPDNALRDPGRALARIQSHEFDWCGSPGDTLRYAPVEFHRRLASTMEQLVVRFYRGNTEIEAQLRPMCEAALALPAPKAGALVMADMDRSQFLTDGVQLTALVDTEAYVVAPRELDLIGMEYVLDTRGAAFVAEGYREVLPLPDVSAVRRVYRYFCRLIRIQGAVRLDKWLAWPNLF